MNQREQGSSSFDAHVTAVQNGFLITINGQAFVSEALDGKKQGFEDVIDVLRIGFYRAAGLEASGPRAQELSDQIS